MVDQNVAGEVDVSRVPVFWGLRRLGWSRSRSSAVAAAVVGALAHVRRRPEVRVGVRTGNASRSRLRQVTVIR